MSFLGGGLLGGGGGGIGSGQIILGAQTAGLRSQVRSAFQQIKSDLNALATDAQVQGARTSAGINRIGASARTNAAEVTASSRSASTAMRTSAAEAEAAGGRWNKVFSLIGTAAKVGMLGVVGAVALGIKSAADFEQQWAAVIKTVGGTPKQMAALRKEFLNLATTMPTSLGDLAKIGETAGALGIPTKDIAAFTKVVAQLGATTNVSVDQAATSLGQLGNVLGLRQKDYERFGSTLVELGNKGASTEKQILDITTRAGAAGKLLGLQTNQILAIASTTASLGINPEAGGTALQKTFVQLLSITNAQDKGTASAGKLRVAQGNLHVAQLKLNEVRGKAHVAASTLAAAELRVEKAQNAVTAASKGSIDKAADLAKVAGMTTAQWKEMLKNDPGKAFQAFISGMGRLTQPQQLAALKEFGLSSANSTRTILGLAAGHKELARQMGISAEAWKANTALQENFAKKTANLKDRIAILANVIKVELIKIGDAILPTLTKIVNWLAVNIPAALQYLGRLWSGFFDKLRGPLAAVSKSVGEFMAALSGPGGGKGIDWAKAIQTAFDGLANVLGTVLKAFAAIIDIGTQLAKSPIGRFATTILPPLLTLVAVLTGLNALAKRLTGWTAGILRGVAGLIPGLGRFTGGGGGDTPESKALVGAGAKLTGSAVALERAAAALSAGGLGGALTPQQRQLANSIGNLPGGGRIAGIEPTPLTRPMTLQERMAYAGTANLDALSAEGFRYPRVPVAPGSAKYGFGQGGVNPDRLTSVPIANKAEYLANQRSFDAAGRGMVGQAQTWLAAGARSAAGVGGEVVGRVKGAASGAFGILKGAGSLIAKAFWPIMLADLATEFLKGPISDIVAQNTPFKNAAAEMATDFWGGARDLLISAFNGTDAWVGHAELTTIGKAKISTLTIAKLGFDSAQIGAMQAPTLENGGYFFQQSAADVLRDQYSKMSPAQIVAAAATSGIDISKYDFLQQAINAGGKGNVLDSGVLKDIASGVADTFGLKGAVENAGLTQKDVQPLVDELVKQQYDGLNDGLNSAVKTALTQMGFDPDQISGLDQSTIDKLGHLIGANVNGKVNALLTWAAHNALQPIIPDTGAIKTSWDILGKRQPAGQPAGPVTPAQLLTSGAILGAAVGTSGGRVPVGKAPAGPPLILSENPNDPNSQYAKQRAAANAAYEQNLAKLTAPMRATYSRWQTAVLNDPTGNREAAQQYGQQFLDTYGKAIATAGKKPKAPDSKVILDLARNIIGPAAITRDKHGVATLATGAWDQIWEVYTQSEQATGKNQRDKIAKTTRDIITAGAKDGSSEAAKAMTQIFFADNQKAIQDAITNNHPNSLYPLIEKYNKANPSDQITGTTKRKMETNFEDAFTAWLKGGAFDPTKPDPLKSVTSTIQGVVDTVAADLKGAGNSVVNFGNIVAAVGDQISRVIFGGGDGANPMGTGPVGRGGGGGARQHPAAGGAFFDTRGRYEMTVGEAGDETVAVLRSPRRFMLPSMRMPFLPSPSIAGAGAQAGRTTQIYADKLQVLGPADETSLMARFAFLSNQ